MSAYTPVQMAGYEIGILAPYEGSSSGTRAIETGIVHRGDYSLRVSPSAGNAHSAVSSTTMDSFGLWVRLSTIPAVDLVVAHMGQGAGTDHRSGIGINGSTGKWRIFHRHSGGSFVYGSDGPTAVANTWTWLSLREESGGTQEGYVGTEALPSLDTTSGHAGGALAVILMGNSIGATATLDFYFDDVVGYVQSFPRPWPIPRCQVELLLPTGEGTHSNASSFTDDAANSPPVNPHLRLDEIPAGATTDFISQTTAGGSSYIELVFGNPVNRGDPIGVRFWMARTNNSGISTSRLTARVVDVNHSSATHALGDLFISSGLQWASDGLETRLVSGSAWVADDIDALLMRVGESTDVSPIPEAHATFMEVAAPWIPDPEPVQLSVPQAVELQGLILPVRIQDGARYREYGIIRPYANRHRPHVIGKKRVPDA